MFSANKIAGYLMAGIALLSCGSGPDLSVNDGGLTLDITDAAVDEVSAVWVEFSGIEFEPLSASANRFSIDFDTPKKINLLALQGSQFERLLNNKAIEAGTYRWMRLKVNALENTQDSYVEANGGRYSLYMPNGSERGLRLSQSFVISASSDTYITIDFDLRKSITAPQSPDVNYTLKPTLRQVMTHSSSHIQGTVNGTTISANCTGTSHAVYAYTGQNTTPDDVDNIGVEPITSSLLTDSTYQYSLGFLPEGDYTISFVCNAADDLPASSEPLTYIGTTNVTVAAKQTTTHDF
ncbi:MAG: DUF4382 domain-containing protein [Gammaproteobacteria bacterium]|nr:DUF4382 domain-containing protein [Gammaproteobacteria bacterium]